ncbi:MAG: ABC transporter ATP-binding protein [Bifidobacteriaceae bacterium]|jgi:branched-chain amino acid transport system ATP-binding protein|nr:ABC transporter ATP-binding protein [Bifidobacteriaceae bacterium]
MDTLEVNGISKNFEGVQALQNVSFSIQNGEIFGLIGPNGSGKTTLINVITGLLPPTAGSVTIAGHNASHIPPYKVTRLGLARTFQSIRLFKDLTVYENVEVGYVGIGGKRKEAQQRSEQLLSEIGLIDLKDQLARELNFAHQRRLEIARALCSKPKFLFLDEPAAGMNETETKSLLEYLKTLPATKNLGVLVVDHDMSLIMNLCHRIHVLNNGTTIAEGSPEEIRHNPQVIEAYLGDTHE